MATSPAQVFNGEGSTCEAAEDAAAETALAVLLSFDNHRHEHTAAEVVL